MTPDINREADLVCEALVREINGCGRWTAVREAWLAILKVRRMAKSLDAENDRDLQGNQASPQRTKGESE